MRFLKTGLSLFLTVALVYALNKGWNLGAPIPPLGKFLDPFHGFWQNAEGYRSGEHKLAIPGIKEEVTIFYDSAQIPHIYAKSDEDLYFTQGYITAIDRLWQMEFQTHAAAGRISEIVGPAALDFDRKQRRLGMVFAAENAVHAMESNETARMVVDNYTNGINTYISSLSYEDYPFEYKLLDYTPEPWSRLKSALLLKYMAQTLNMGEKDLEMTNALSLYGKEMVDLLWPDYEGVADPIVEQPGKWNFKPVEMASTPVQLPNETVALEPFEKSPPDVGSNNWTVAGSKTKTGSPILCGDPHLNLSLPSIWYAVHLWSPTVNVMGVSLPGSPNVIIGFNDSIAWSVTNAQRDLVDWYKIQFKDQSKSEYLSDSTWKPTRKVVEKFIRKGAAPFYDTVIYTHHGPVVYDESYHGGNESAHFAFRWIAHDASEELLTFVELNRASNHNDYMHALDHYGSPAQNFVFASASGDIAMRIQGKYPARRPEEGKYILDGTRTSEEWKAFIPNEQNVMYKNPERGFASSANQYPVDLTYPYYVNGSSFEAYRNRSINNVLREAKDVTVADMMKLQNDNYNLKAEESLPYFLSQLDPAAFSDTEKKAYEVLKGWDFFNNMDSQGASYYEAWWDALMPMIWDELDSAHVALKRPTTYQTIKLLKEKPDLQFFDLVSTPEKETSKEILRLSFTKGVSDIEAWKSKSGKDPGWAAFKDSYIGHLLRQEALSYHIVHGGNHDIVNAHSKTHGPSWRMVVSLEKGGPVAYGVYPGGQSGNPGSPYYNDMIELWTHGKYHRLHFGQLDEVKKFQSSSTTLTPGK
ncbi:MAG: penicillin acylase family protein [Bacteroidetes bacterium]|nr:penicillin acylase family protein [Bacteroidota bacterium]